MLINFDQELKNFARSDADLKGSLLELASLTPVWPAKRQLIGFAQYSLGVDPAQEDRWYQQAWWGFHAARLLGQFQKEQRHDAVLGLLEGGTIDWSPLDETLAQGKGVVVASAHLGTGYVPGLALKHRGMRVLEIANTEGDGKICVGSDADRKGSLVHALKFVQSGGTIIGAPTGRFGRSFIMSKFLGQDFPIFLGIGEIARLSGAASFWPVCSWQSAGTLRLSFEPLPQPQGDDRMAWLKQWYAAYFERLGAQMKRSPADLGFRFGFWSDAGGLNWKIPPREPLESGRE